MVWELGVRLHFFRRAIEKLKAENEALKESLAIESRGMMQPNDAATQVSADILLLRG